MAAQICRAAAWPHRVAAWRHGAAAWKLGTAGWLGRVAGWLGRFAGWLGRVAAWRREEDVVVPQLLEALVEAEKEGHLWGDTGRCREI